MIANNHRFNEEDFSVVSMLRTRELGRKKSYSSNQRIIMIPSIEKRLDSAFNDISKCVKALRTAIEAVKWKDIEHAVRILFSKLLDVSHLPDESASTAHRKRQERDGFVSLGGMHLLLRLFEKPFSDPDARSMSASVINKHSELWNEVLVLLREISYSIPSLSEHLFGNKHIIFLFTLLAHRSVFENSISLLEEILAVRIDTFSLALVPHIYALISKLSTRQLAHFCRVLSLVLFEPEDRQIMEGTHVLSSLELLQLRRDRMAKASNIVERNQCLMIDMPNLLKRLLILMRVTNYGPNLAELARHSISAQDAPGNADLFQFISTTNIDAGTSEWDYLLSLDTIVKNAEESGQLTSSKTSPIPSITTRPTAVPDANTTSENSVNENSFFSDFSIDETMAELLRAFGEQDRHGPADLSALMSVVQIAQSLGLTAIAPDGEPILSPDTLPTRGFGFGRSGRRNLPCNVRANPPAPAAAKKELQFHAMFLNPHHVELLFVLCTLLSGRRKINVQEQLAGLGLADVLLDMYSRMSWDAQPFHGHNPMEHIHGPGCDCNPESALRVQYLRLVHNFYDRDFLGNSNKKLLLSSTEKLLLTRCGSPSEVSKEGFFIGNNDKGIFTRIVHTLLKEPVESVYRFWLSSCLESFLRGSGLEEQVFIAISGVLSYTVTHIVDQGLRPSANVNLQTAFDLLGELVKGNRHTIEMVDSTLGETNFKRFMNVVLSNLVDSNVFLRSLYLSIDVFNDSEAKVWKEEDKSANESGGYLSHSWIQFCPEPVSKSAIELLKRNQRRNNPENERKKVQKVQNRNNIRSSGSVAQQAMSLPYTAAPSSSQSGRFKNEVGTPPPSPLSSSSRLTHGVRGAIQNIREAASHYLTFTSPISPNHRNTRSENTEQKIASSMLKTVEREREKEFVRHNSQQFMDVKLLKEDRSLEGDGDEECDYDEFFTPPEAPKFSRVPNGITEAPIIPSVSSIASGSKSMVLPAVSSSSIDKPLIELSSALGLLSVGLPTAVITPIEQNIKEESQKLLSIQTTPTKFTSTNDSTQKDLKPIKETEKDSKSSSNSRKPASVAAILLPETLHRFHSFLKQEKEYIVLRLMSTVTIYSINHENICCLNTALLILLLADRRGQLCGLLESVRRLASSQTSVDPPGTPSSGPGPPLNRGAVRSASSCNGTDDSLSTSLFSAPSSSAGSGCTSRACACFLDEKRISEKEERRLKGDSDSRKEDSVVEKNLQDLNPYIDENLGDRTYCMNCTGGKEIGLVNPDSVPFRVIEEKLRFMTPSTSPSPAGEGRSNLHEKHTSSSDDKSDYNNTKDRNHDENRHEFNFYGNEAQTKKLKQQQVDTKSLGRKYHHGIEDPPISKSDAADYDIKAHRVMVNFRELLWYWREYYLRRGRDRLSIEFSSHIHFYHWDSLVDKLCGDDGSPTSLLPSRISLPMSPYNRPSRFHSNTSIDLH